MTENWAQIKEIWKYYVTKEEIVNSIYSYHWSVHNTSTTQLSYRTTQPSSIVPQILGFMSVRVHVHSPSKSKYESKLASRRDEVGCGTHQRQALASQTWERSWNLKKSGVSDVESENKDTENASKVRDDRVGHYLVSSHPCGGEKDGLNKRTAYIVTLRKQA